MRRPTLASLSVLTLLTLAASCCWAFLPPAQERLPNFDKRNQPAPKAGVPRPEQTQAVAELRSRLPSARVDFDEITAAPAMIADVNGFLTGPDGQGRGVSAIATSRPGIGGEHRPTKAFISEYNRLFGHGPEALDSARITRQFVTAHNGLTTTVWEQQVDGIAVFAGVLISHTTKRGELVSISSKFVREAEKAAERGTPNRTALLAAPTVTARQALLLAATNVGDEGKIEEVMAAGERTSGVEKVFQFRAAFLLGDSEGKLSWLPTDSETLRLCWQVTFTSRKRDDMFRILVDAQTGEVWVRHSLTEYLSDVSYRVFTSDSPSPFSPGNPTPTNYQPPLVSRALVTWPALDTNASPAGWIDDGGNETRGNNVDAHTDRNNDNLPDLPRPQGSPFRVFDYPMDLSAQAPTNYSQAAVVQLFYLCNWMHDKLYELGFTEAAGNFQSNNFSRGGLGNDALQADAQDGGGLNNANMATPSDGSPPRMQMYIFDGPSPDRDGDLDAEVVLHEYTHGLSNRRVGGGVGISALQSQGMGEGWSDFYALALLSEPGDNVNDVYAAGGYSSYLIGASANQNYYFGIRRYPYTTDMSKNPLSFKDIDSAQAAFCSSGAPYNVGMFGSCSTTSANEVHNQGELWCVTLWETRARLVTKYGWAVGNQLILQLVTDGMNLSPANPTFLQARDAIIQADLVDTGGANRNDLWAAFAKRGMGLSATSPVSSTTTGVHEAFDLPDNLQITPGTLTASGMFGGPFTPNPATFVLTNAGSNTLNWTLANTSVWINVSPTGGSLAAGAGSNVNVSINAAANAFAPGSYTAGVWFTNQTSGVAQMRPFRLSVVGRNMFDDFEPGIDLSQWSEFGGVLGSTVNATNYGGSVSGVNSLWFGANGSRYAISLPIDTSLGGTISFYLHLANGTGVFWETVDIPAEGVVLEYSTNSGSSWTIAGTYDTSTYYNWTFITLPIPAGAQSPVTQFRWRQLSNSGSCCDHWALDDVSVNSGPSPPIISTQPANRSVLAGGTASFSVSVAGSSPFSYQWRFNSFNISGGTNSTFTLTGVTANQAGQYSVVVSNAYGSVTSSNASLTVVSFTGFNVLLLWDTNNANTASLTNALVNAGINVTMSATSESGYDGSNPSPTGFNAVIHLNGTTYNNDMPLAGQNALVSYVQNGGGYLHSEWDAYEFGLLRLANMRELILLDRTNGSNGLLTLTNVPGQSAHPVLTNLPSSFSFSAGYNVGTNHVFATNRVTVLMRDASGNDAVVVRQVGAGRVVGFHHAGNYENTSGFNTLAKPYVQQLFINGVFWAAGAGPNVPPTIIVCPQSQIVVAGSNATFLVSATGSNPLSYQWRFNSSELGGATNALLGLTAVSTNQAGNYDVVVTNAFGAVTSAPAVLTVYLPTPPVITQQPQSQTAIAGTNLTLGVVATGDIPLYYQWFFNTTNLAGATSQSLTLLNVQATNAGDYFVTVTNSLGSITSQVATLAVVFAPGITQAPQDLTVVAGSNALFSVGATGTAPLYFQWRHSGTNLPGRTQATLSLANVVFADSGLYDAIVSNTYGTVISPAATLTVVSPPVISQQPLSQSLPAGRNVSLNVVASGSGTLSYQWRFNGAEIPGATDSAWSIANVQSGHSGAYTVVITNFVGSATSEVATLSVNPALPLATVQPRPQGVFPGMSVTFNVAAAGTDPITYQWQLNGIDLPGATNLSLVITNAQSANTGLYRAVLSNSVGAASSDQALLALVPVVSWGLNDSQQNNLPLELTNAVEIAAGSQHNVALRRDGPVVAWGAPDQTNVPPELTNVLSVAAGGGHSLALRADGSVVAWGGNNGSGQTNVPSTLSNVVAIAAGGSHSLALKSDGTVTGWGLNLNGQSSAPAGLTNVIAIAAGSNHSIALKADGKLAAWGANGSGQSTPPTNLTDVVAIAAGSSHSIALKADGGLVIWGASTYSQTNIPAGVSNIVGIAAGAFHTLAFKNDGTPLAWGAGTTNSGPFPHYGQCVIPTMLTNCGQMAGGAGHSLALAAAGPPFILEPPISRSGYSGRRVVFRASAAGARPLRYQWQFNGSNLDGATNQLLVLESPAMSSAGNYRLVVSNAFGTATSADATLVLIDRAPFVLTQPVARTVFLGGQTQLQVAVDGSGPFFYQWRFNGVDLPGAVSSTLLLNRVLLAQGGNYSVVVSNAFGVISSAKANLSVAQVAAWGAGTNITATPNLGQSIVPVGLNNAVNLSGGLYHSLAVRSDSRVAAWGAGTNTPFSLPNYGQSIVPTGLSNVVQTAGGGYHSLALKSDGTIVAWGAGTTNNSISPNYGQSIVPALASNVIALAAGDLHSVALRNDGRVVVWGYNGYLQTNVPTAATSNVVAIASRGNHVLALKSDGSLVHWGMLTSLPLGVSNIVTIAAGVNHCLALKNDGTVVSWGNQTLVPAGLSNVVDIAAGLDHSLALKSDGTVVTWGATNLYFRDAIPAGLTNVIGIACGAYNSLAFLGDGSPLIKWQPANRSTFLGSAATFNVTALGGQPLRYQWQFNGAAIASATNSYLTIPATQAADAGNYRVVVTNVFGSLTSAVASLTVLVPLGEALDAPGLLWSTSGNAAWFGENIITHDLSDAAQSGLITDNQQSSLSTIISGPGTLSFWWKVSSEEFFDFLSFSIDGIQQAGISGEVNWQQLTYPVSAGSHLLRWTYAKDSTVNTGSDAAWLDQVNFVTNPPVITLQPLSQTASMGALLSMSVSALGAPPFVYQWLKGGTNLVGATAQTYTILNATRRDSSVYSVLVSNPGGTTASSNAIITIRVPQSLGIPSRGPDDKFRLTSGDADRGALLPGDLANIEPQVSTNLVDWAPLTNSVMLTNGVLLVIDPQSTNYPTRFYRVIER